MFLMISFEKADNCSTSEEIVKNVYSMKLKVKIFGFCLFVLKRGFLYVFRAVLDLTLYTHIFALLPYIWIQE